MGKRSTEADFWRQVAAPNEQGCRLWTGALKDGRYGTFKHQNRADRTHRWAWFFTYGPIPSGMNVLHHCDTPLCCEPTCLFLGTHVDNMRDREAKGRNRPRTRASGTTKLTVQQADEIRARWTGGKTTAALAEEFGVSGVMVWKLGTGRA